MILKQQTILSQQQKLDQKHSKLQQQIENKNKNNQYSQQQQNNNQKNNKQIIINNNNNNKKKVLLLYYSGCAGANEKMQIYKNNLQQKIFLNRYLCDLQTIQNHSQSFIKTPKFENGSYIQYKIHQFKCIKQSTNQNINEIYQLATIIQQNYSEYDSFIILTGLDLICYISTLLSFMLENLNKLVIFTGTYFPISYIRCDVINNLIQCFTIINYSQYFNDVIIVCNHKGFRANRCIKYRQEYFDCISSPNLEPLVSLNIKISNKIILQQLLIEIRTNLFEPIPKNPFTIFTHISQRVQILKYNIYLTIQSLKYLLLNPQINGYVIQSYGCCNLPYNNIQMLNLFKQIHQQKGTIFINISQTSKRNAKSSMKQKLQNYHIIYGGDMTSQAALAKLSYCLGKKWDYSTICNKIQHNLRGELTEDNSNEIFKANELKFHQILHDILMRYCQTKDQQKLQISIINKIAIQLSQLERTKKQQFINFCKKNQQISLSTIIDQNYLLHKAIKSNNYELIILFISQGCNINLENQIECSPSYYTLNNYNRKNNKKIIQFLKHNGAYVICPKYKLISIIIQNLKKDNQQFFNLLYHMQFKYTLQYVINQQKRNIAHLAALFKANKCLDLLKNKFKIDFLMQDKYSKNVYDYINDNNK